MVASAHPSQDAHLSLLPTFFFADFLAKLCSNEFTDGSVLFGGEDANFAKEVAIEFEGDVSFRGSGRFGVCGFHDALSVAHVSVLHIYMCSTLNGAMVGGVAANYNYLLMYIT